MMRNRIYIILLVLLTAPLMFAQGSAYTRLGLGDIISSSSARYTGMGSLGIGAKDVFSIAEVNPASWSGIGLTRFQTSLSYLGKSIEDNRASSNYSEAAFSGFSVAVPLQRDWGLVTSFGILPVSRVDYTLNQKSLDKYFGNVTKEFSGKGGLSKMYFGTSYKLPFGLVVGGEFEYYFGKIDYKSAISLPDTLNFSNVTYTYRKGYSGIGATFGLLSPNLSEKLNVENIQDLRFGFTYSIPANINTDTSMIASTSQGANEFVNGLTESFLPAKIGVGFSARFNKQYLLFADYIIQDWKNYKLAGRSENNLDNYMRANLGMEILGEQNEFSTFWEQIDYRFGLSYEQTQYRMNNSSVLQYALHAGLSFPMGLANSIDLGLTIGLRGKKDTQLLEKFFGTSVSLNFGDLWFVRRKN